MEQIYKILRDYKLSAHENPFIGVNYKFRHNHIIDLPLELRSNVYLCALLLDIKASLPRTHYSDDNLDWIGRSLTINMSYNNCNLKISKPVYYGVIDMMLSHSILFRLSKRGKYLVNPYMLNVLSQAQAEHIISTVAHGTVQGSRTVCYGALRSASLALWNEA